MRKRDVIAALYGLSKSGRLNRQEALLLREAARLLADEPAKKAGTQDDTQKGRQSA